MTESEEEQARERQKEKTGKRPHCLLTPSPWRPRWHPCQLPTRRASPPPCLCLWPPRPPILRPPAADVPTSRATYDPSARRESQREAVVVVVVVVAERPLHSPKSPAPAVVVVAAVARRPTPSATVVVAAERPWPLPTPWGDGSAPHPWALEVGGEERTVAEEVLRPRPESGDKYRPKVIQGAAESLNCPRAAVPCPRTSRVEAAVLNTAFKSTSSSSRCGRSGERSRLEAAVAEALVAISRSPAFFVW